MSILKLLVLLFLLSLHPTVAEENITYENHYTEINMPEENLNMVQEIEEVNSSLMTLDRNTTEPEISPYIEALQKAQDENKVIMLAIRAVDCSYCDRMERETLVDESVKQALEENFITLHYNQDIEVLPLGLPEGMTPNFVFVDKEENIINMYPGMRTPDEFKEALKEILSQ
jgi:thioredoxin-related protein